MLNTNLNTNALQQNNNIFLNNTQRNKNIAALSFSANDVVQISNNTSLKLPSIYSKGKHVELVSFGLNSEKTQQGRGIFLHVQNLPPSSSNSPIGELVGEQTNQFIDFLHNSKQNIWSINPLTPFGQDLCPYNSSSRFERSPYYINQQRFFDDDYQLLGANDRPLFDSLKYERKDKSSFSPDEFTLDDCKTHKDPIFTRAYENFKAAGENHVLRAEFNAYIKEEGAKWLDSCAVFSTIQGYMAENAKSDEKANDWTTWRKELITLPENPQYQNSNTLEEKLNVMDSVLPEDKKLTGKDRQNAEEFQFKQFLFDHQFKELKGNLDKKNVRMLVDLAYAVDPKGSDVWGNKDIVKLDKEDNSPAVMTGCMPEGAYPWTQMWAQAVWNYESKAFWKYSEDVMNKTLEETGALRLDHFGGLINRGAISTKLKGDDIVDTLMKAYMREDKNNYLKADLVKMLKNPGDEVKAKMGGDFDVKNATPQDVKQVLTRIFEPDETYKTQEITKKKEEGGKYGLISFWKDEWLEDVYKKPNLITDENNLIDTYLRIAAEKGLNLKNTFVLEDLGGVGTTELFQKEFLPAKFSPKTDKLKLSGVAQERINEAKGTSYQELFSFFRVPVTYGIGDPSDGNLHNPYGFARNKNDKGFYPRTTTVVTSNHDTEAFLQTIKNLSESKTRTNKQREKGIHKGTGDYFRKFLRKYDIAPPKLENGRANIADTRKTMQDIMEKYFYSDKIGFKNVIISFNDAIGVMRRPNCPGLSNFGKTPADCDKFAGYDLAPPELFPNKYDKDPREAMKKAQAKTWMWGFTFKPNFLTTSKSEGGYKERADEFVAMQNRLH